MTPPRSRTFHYDAAPVRVRARGGEPVWFTRDLAAALGTWFPSGPLLPASGNALPGMATTAQVWEIVGREDRGVPEAFRAWMAEVSALMLTRPARVPAQGAGLDHPGERRARTA